MNQVVSIRLMVYLVAGVALMAAGAASGRGGLVALGAPLVLAVLISTARRPAQPASGRARVDLDDVAEDDEIALTIDLVGRPHQTVELALVVPSGVSLVDGHQARQLRLGRNGRLSTRIAMTADRWGHHRLGTFVLRSGDPLGLVAVDRVVDDPATVRVRPRTEHLTTSILPLRTRPASGNHPARVAGAGIEFAGIRPYQPGDRARDLSWRASARRDTAMVIQHHPERSGDVILFVDTFAPEGLDETIRAAVTVARHQLADRDRVGLVVFGGTLRWLRAGTGGRQFRLIADALVDARAVASWAARDVATIPPRMLPTGASILAVTPLIDERAIAAVGDLRRRRYEVSVIEVSPSRWTPEPGDDVARLALRLWRLQRATLRGRLAGVGVPVVEWHEGVPLEVIMRRLEGLTTRRARWLAS